MQEVEQLRERYRQYRNQVQKLMLEAKPFAGIFGFGSGPKDDPCHHVFYEDIVSSCQAFADQPIPPETAAALVRYIIGAQNEGERQEISYWPMMAAHGAVLPLIPLLTREQAAELAGTYERLVPRRERMPLQEKILKQLRQKAV